MEKRTLLAWAVATVCFLVLMLVTPSIPQDQQYHDFADQRQFLEHFQEALQKDYSALRLQQKLQIWFFDMKSLWNSSNVNSDERAL